MVVKGFTFWEVLVLLVVIGVLATAALPRYAGITGKDNSKLPTKLANRTSEADAFLNSLFPANIAFNTPQSMEVGKTYTIELILSLQHSFEELEGLALGPPIETARIQVSNVLEAKIVGSSFSILPITQQKQAIASSDITRWKWDITPEVEGLHKLHLTIDTTLTVDGETTPRTIQTFDREINVIVTLENRVKTWVRDYWQWFLTAILIPFGVFLWNKRKGANTIE